MTIEKAIYCIREFAIYHAKGDLPYSARTLEALGIAIKSLEKQMPKKPKITAFGVECSNCGSIVDFGPNVARLNGCPWCL